MVINGELVHDEPVGISPQKKVEMKHQQKINPESQAERSIELSTRCIMEWDNRDYKRFVVTSVRQWDERANLFWSFDED